MKLKALFYYTLTFVAAFEKPSIEDIFSDNILINNFFKKLPGFVGKDNPDVLSNVPDILKRHGYKFETHNVTTSDGYILTVFQILAKNENPQTNPVFLQHGVAQNSAVWVDVGERSLAFQLVEKGYEVWLGNVRGTVYSQKHTKFSVNDPAYWNFTLDTIAENDMLAQLEKVYTKTKRKAHYIGHSMGTTLALMFSSWNSDKAEKMLKSSVLLAPVAYLNNVAVIEQVKIPALLLIDLLDSLKYRGFLYQTNEIHKFLVKLCAVISDVCISVANAVFGSSVQTLKEDVPLLVSYWPEGASIYQYKQYLQICWAARFQKYDFGKSNVKVYGTKQPPSYDLSKIKIPTCLLYGEKDNLYNKKDVERLFDEIGSSNKCKYSIPSANSTEKFTHIDFLYSSKIIDNLYKRLFEVLQEFEK